MKYIFILGRNPELSKAEIFSYLKRIGNMVIRTEEFRNSILIELENELEKKTIIKLGGTIAIGKVICKTDLKELESQTLYFGTKNKMNYCIWNFSKDNSYNKISEYLKKRFRQEKLKTTEKPLTGSLKLQDGKEMRISSGLIDEEYFIFNDSFGKITEKCNYKELEFRDMRKPTRRQELAISPRLAKIIINLSEVKEGEVILDCFCGVGSILVEALLQGIKVIGIDRDENAILGANKNLKWFGFSEKNYEIILGDSARIKTHLVNVVVTEPDLGVLLKHIPSKEQTEKILARYEGLIIKVINNLKKRVSGKIVFTAPLIRQKQERISCNIERICDKTDLKLIKSFQEYRKDQIVSRNIFVLGR